MEPANSTANSSQILKAGNAQPPFERVLTEVSARLVNATVDQIDAEIVAAQRSICEVLDLDLSAIWEPIPQTATLRLAYHYRRLEGPPIPSEMRADLYFPWCAELLAQREALAVNSTEDVPPEAARDRESWRHFHIKSSLMLPLRGVGGAFLGTLSFDSISCTRDWPADLISRVLLVAQVFAGTLVRKKTLADLQASELRFRSFSENSLAGVYIIENGRLDYVNSSFAGMFGYGIDELIGADPLQLIHQDDRQIVIDKIAQALAGTINVARYECRGQHNNGDIIWLEILGSRLELGHRVFLLGNVLDITDRKLKEHALHRSEEQFRMLTDKAPVAIAFSRDARVIYANQKYMELFGIGIDEVLGHSVLEQWAPESRPELAERARRRGLGLTVPGSCEEIGLRRDGSRFPCHIDLVSIELSDGPAVAGFLSDISEGKKHEEEIAAYLARIERMFISTIDVVSRMGEMRDPYTTGHQRRVGSIAAAIGAELGLSEDAQKGLAIASAVHDLGKIGVPAEILTKPGRLTPVEYELIKAHAERGYEVLRHIDAPWPIADVAWQHHERMDGSGYPRGLKGNEICLEARIVAVADVVESMTTHRPYRAAVGNDAALEEISKNRGKLYDEAVVDACVRLFRKGEFRIPA